MKTIPLSQMEQIKAEDHMSDYKSSSTEEFYKNSQESDGLEEHEYDEDDVDNEDESVSDESEDVDGGKVGEDGDGELHISSIYHHHIEHFFTFLAGNTVFSLVRESPR